MRQCIYVYAQVHVYLDYGICLDFVFGHLQICAAKTGPLSVEMHQLNSANALYMFRRMLILWPVDQPDNQMFNRTSSYQLASFKRGRRNDSRS